MYMTDQQRLAEARALSASLDRLTRMPRRFSPSAPWIIPATMIVVAVFAIVCFVIKLLTYYLSSKQEKEKKFGISSTSSPELPTTPDQASMATTASMKTRRSLRVSSRARRGRPPPVSLYQIKQMQSPGTSSSSKSKNKAAMRAMSKAARAEANRSLSRNSTRQADDDSDDANNIPDNSPTDISQHSDDTDEIQTSLNQSGFVYGAASSGAVDEIDANARAHGSDQPEVHIVQIRDLEDNVQHSQPTWSKTESDI